MMLSEAVSSRGDAPQQVLSSRLPACSPCSLPCPCLWSLLCWDHGSLPGVKNIPPSFFVCDPISSITWGGCDLGATHCGVWITWEQGQRIRYAENICGSSVLHFDGLCFMSLFPSRSTLFYGFMTDHPCPVVVGKEHSQSHWGNWGKTGD